MLEKVGGLLQSGIARQRLIVGQSFFLQLIDSLEEQDFSVHVYAHVGQVPVPLSDVPLLDDEGPVFVQVPQQAAGEPDFAGQPAIDLNQPLLPVLHNQCSFHVVEN